MPTKVHITLTDENLFNVDKYKEENNYIFRSDAVNDLLSKAIEYYQLMKFLDEIKSLEIKQLGYLKTIEDFNKILITALDIRSIKDINSNPIIQDYFKHTKGDHSD